MRHRYGDHFHQFADLYLPPEPDGPLPVAVVLHAGFWREQYSLELSEDLARDLPRRGWAAWNVEYRRVGEAGDGGYPPTLEDVAAAIDFLQTLDAPVDLARVVTIGQSAGGHLALWAATREAPAVPLAGGGLAGRRAGPPRGGPPRPRRRGRRGVHGRPCRRRGRPVRGRLADRAPAA